MLAHSWKPTAHEGFTVVDFDRWDQAVVRCLFIVKTDALGVVNYHKGTTLPIGCVLWRCVKVQTVVEHTFTG